MTVDAYLLNPLNPGSQVCSIHQPRGSIFQMFDDLVLLADGQLVYQGAAEGALQFFEEQG